MCQTLSFEDQLWTARNEPKGAEFRRSRVRLRVLADSDELG